MKQVEQNYRSGNLRVIEVPVPRPSHRSTLVRTHVSLISAGTEKQMIKLAQASLAGKAMARPDLVRQVVRKVKSQGVLAVARTVFAKLNTPIPLGYSLAGKVVEAGADSGFAVGERIACAGAGIANHAEYNAVPRNLSVRIPQGVSDEDASFVTVGAIALQGVRIANPTLGESVVVIGLGLIGLISLQLLKANGCRVLGFDPNPRRVALALALGADAAVSDNLAGAALDFTGRCGADAVIVAASTKSSEPLNQAAEISRLKGRVVLVGLVGMTIDRDPFYKRELDLRLSMSYGPGRHDPAYEGEGHDYPLPYVRWTEQRNMEAFLELVAAGKVTPSRLVTHRFGIAEAEKAYQLMDSEEPYLAILLIYDDVKPPVRVVELRKIEAPRGDGVAFIGFGNYAKGMLLPAFRKAGGGELRTVVTASGLSAHGAAEKMGFARAATDPEEALGDPAVSTVFIATRHSSHAELAIRALEAGKNVFVEKPLAISEEQLQAVMAAARAAPGVLTVGFNRRFAPMVVAAREALQQRAGPLAMTYRINAGSVPPEHWIHNESEGGRIVGEACHFVDTLSAIAGFIPVAVEAVSPQGLEDTAAAVLRFADGSVGTILYSSMGDPTIDKEKIEIFGSGVVVQIADFSSLSITRNGRTSRRRAAQDKGQMALMKAFMDACRGKAEAPISLDDLEAVSIATLAMAGR